jgi:hypothetical protein
MGDFKGKSALERSEVKEEGNGGRGMENKGKETERENKREGKKKQMARKKEYATGGVSQWWSGGHLPDTKKFCVSRQRTTGRGGGRRGDHVWKNPPEV